MGHRHLEVGVVADHGQLRGGKPQSVGCGAQRVERRLAHHLQPAAGERPDHRRDRPGGAERPASGHREERRLRAAVQLGPVPDRLAGRLQRGHGELGEPAGQHRISRSASHGSHNVKPRLPQRLGQPGAAQQHDPLVAGPEQDPDRAAGRRQHRLVRQREPEFPHVPRVGRGRPVGPVGEHHERPPALRRPPGDLQRAGQRPQPVAGPVAEHQRAVHVEHEPARRRQPIPHHRR